MRRLFVIEAKSVAVVSNHVDAGERGARSGALGRRLRPLPIRIVGRIGLVEREGMQNIGEQQFLVLLLVIESDFDNRNELPKVFARFDQCRHRVIDMGAIRGDFGCSRPRDQTALRARLSRAG
jgi:hypothetical protein